MSHSRPMDPSLHHQAGLFALSPPADAPPGYVAGAAALGLRGVDVHAEVRDLCARVTISQRYVNQRGTADCEYRFPLDSRAAVCGFEVEVDGILSRGEVQAKAEARQTYTAAIASGAGAQLLEQDRGDMFCMSVGNVRPGQTVTVKLSYVTDLKIDGNAVVFYLPTYIAPRCCAASDPSPLPADHAAPQSVGDGLHLTARVDMGTAITSVTSETHAAGLTVGPAPPRARDDSAPAAAGDDCRSRLVTLRQGTPVLDADIVIKIATASPHQPRCIVETLPNGSRAAVLTLAPKIELDSERAEIVFVVDCSGSMSGWNMRQASRAMQLFLRSLPVDCFVNIVRFGSRYTSLWPSPRKYTASTMAEAARYIEGMQADLGGTAMQAPLAHVLGQPAVQGYSRQVFVLTDGAVSNTASCIDTVSRGVKAYVDEHRRPCRVFGLGLGHGASRELVEGIARVGGGTADFVLDTELAEKVIAQLKTALQPALNAVTVEWKGCDPVAATNDASPLGTAAASPDATPAVPPPSPTVVGSLLGYIAHRRAPVSTLLPAPFTAPPVFSGSRYLAFCLVAPGASAPSAVHVTAETPAGKLDVHVPVEHAVSSHPRGIIHPMAARALIRDLEDGSSWLHAAARPTDVTADKVKAEITRLAIAHSLVSTHTSFVAVQTDGKPAVVERSSSAVVLPRPSMQGPEEPAWRCRTGNRIAHAQRIGDESEAIGAGVLSELDSQRNTIIRNEIYRDLASLVDEQGEQLDNIGNNMIDSCSMSNSNAQLCKAKSARPTHQKIGDFFSSLNPFGGPKMVHMREASPSTKARAQPSFTRGQPVSSPRNACAMPIGQDLASVQTIMSSNISGILSRSDKLDNLNDRSEDLATCSRRFSKASKKTGGGWSIWTPFSAAKSSSPSAGLTRSLPSKPIDRGMPVTNMPDRARQDDIGSMAANARAIDNELAEQNALLDELLDACLDEDNSGSSIGNIEQDDVADTLANTQGQLTGLGSQVTRGPFTAATADDAGGDTLLALTRLQEFSGSFPLTADLCAVVGADLATAKAAAKQLAAGDATVDAMAIIATLLALGHFAETLSDKRAVWELVAKKAHTWLKASCDGLQLGDAMASNMAGHGFAAAYAQLVVVLG